jgi:hypothetical protein
LKGETLTTGIKVEQETLKPGKMQGSDSEAPKATIRTIPGVMDYVVELWGEAPLVRDSEMPGYSARWFRSSAKIARQ